MKSLAILFFRGIYWIWGRPAGKRQICSSFLFSEILAAGATAGTGSALISMQESAISCCKHGRQGAGRTGEHT